MRAHFIAACVALAVMVVALFACQAFFPTLESEPTDGGASDGGVGADGAPMGDGSSDGAGDVAVSAQDFSISVNPSYLALAPGQSASVMISVQRKGTFTGEIDISLGLPPYVNPPGSINTFIPGGSTSISFSLTSMVNAPPALAQMGALGDFPLTVYGKTTDDKEEASAPFTIHLSGKLVVYGTHGTTPFQVPSNVPLLLVKAWGAGGGPGCNGGNGGGPGGAGGFVEGEVVVAPSEMLSIHVGAAGQEGCFSNMSTGGGEGSAVLRSATRLVVAGGGGGGGAGCQAIGGTGGAGGGVKGGDGPTVDCGGIGGGGATPNADGISAKGSSGGGGSGLHDGGTGGGGSAGQCTCPSAGGGGGASGGSDTPDAGVTVNANLTALAGASLPPNTADPDYVANAGRAAGPNLTQQQQVPASDGLIIILVP
jgi:hypothetical protein